MKNKENVWKTRYFVDSAITKVVTYKVVGFVFYRQRGNWLISDGYIHPSDKTAIPSQPGLHAWFPGIWH